MSLLAWHFCSADRRLGYGDSRAIRVGETLTVDGEVVLYKRGLHGSVDIRDALMYCSGATVQRVRLSREIVRGDVMAVASARTCLAMDDAAPMLVVFARWCARRSYDSAYTCNAFATDAAYYANYANACADSAASAYASADANVAAAVAYASADYAAVASSSAAYYAAEADDTEIRVQSHVLERLMRKLLYGSAKKGD